MEEYIIELPGIINSWYYSRDYFQYYLNKAGGKPVRLKVNSLGGDVNQALAISRLIEENGNVTVEFIGFNASAATWMAFGSKKIEIHEDCMWLAHKSAVPVDLYGSMNHDQIEQAITELKNKQKSSEAIDLMIASKYADRSGKSIKEVLDLMTESRWMSATEAKDWGFVDEVIPGINKAAKITNEIIENFAACGLPKPIVNKDSNEENKPAELSGEVFIEKVVNGIKAFLTPKKNSINDLNNCIMNKEFVSVNQILNVEGLTENEGKVTLTIAQLKSINEALAAANAAKETAENSLTTIKNEKQEAISAKETAENNYNSAITAIDGLSDEVKNTATVEGKVEVIKNILEKVPGMKPAIPTNQGGKNDFKEIAVDPVNLIDED